jgi:hypothetical protein
MAVNHRLGGTVPLGNHQDVALAEQRDTLTSNDEAPAKYREGHSV